MTQGSSCSFSRACSDGTRGNDLKLNQGKFRLDRRKEFFMMQAVKPWTKLLREVVDAPSPETFIEFQTGLGWKRA